MPHIWRLEGYWVALESTRWTAVDPTIWVHQTEADFEDVFEKVMDESALWVNLTTSESRKVKQYAEWKIKWVLAVNSIWFFLKSLLGSVATTNPSVWVYEHEFTTLNSNTKPSLTISKKTPVWAYKYALTLVDSLGLTAKVWESVNMVAGLKWKASASATLTKAYTSDYKLYSKDVIIKLADNIAWLDWASSLCLEDIELNITQELEESFCFSSGVDLWDIYNKGFSIDWNFTQKKTNDTYKDYVKNGTYKAMRIEIKDSNTDLWGGNYPTLKVDIARVSFEKVKNDWGLDEIIRENITFKWHYDLVNSADITITLVNKQATY